MNKHKIFLYLFLGISVVRCLLSIFFGDCFLFHHLWLLYMSYFVIIGIGLFVNVPTVSLCQRPKEVECIMLGNGTMTDEIFDRRKYGNYTLLFSSLQGNAYASNNGEMVYTKPVFLKEKEGDTALALLIYTVLYTCIGLYTYEVVVGVSTGVIDMNRPIGCLKQNIASFNLLSDKYPVRENARYILDCMKDIYMNTLQTLVDAYESIID